MWEKKIILKTQLHCSQNNLLWYLKTVDFALDKGMYESLMQKTYMYFNTSNSCLLVYISLSDDLFIIRCILLERKEPMFHF